MTAGVYLLHYERPAAWRPSNPPRHYLGRSKDVQARLQAHREGRGGRFTAAMAAAGIGFTVARTWPENSWDLERRLKARGGGRRLCPVCREAS